MFIEVRFGDLDTKHEFNIFLKTSARINQLAYWVAKLKNSPYRGHFKTFWFDLNLLTHFLGTLRGNILAWDVVSYPSLTNFSFLNVNDNAVVFLKSSMIQHLLRECFHLRCLRSSEQSNFYFQGFRCRVYEMDGHVVARGIVPSSLCTPQAFAQINLNIAHLVRDYIWIIDQLKKWIAYVLKLTLFTRIHVWRALNLI